MTIFKQKVFSEFDAMRSLFVELVKNSGPNKFQMIKLNALLPVLKGNNVVIERFVISTGFFKRDTYRMYLKIGAKAKMPDEVRLPSSVYDKTLLNSTLNIGFDGNTVSGTDQPPRVDFKSESADNEKLQIRLFANKNKKKNNNNNDGAYPRNGLRAGITMPINITYEVKELLGDAINYDKKSRSLVLEFNTIQDAIRAINILPFGVNYKIYLLDINS